MLFFTVRIPSIVFSWNNHRKHCMVKVFPAVRKLQGVAKVFYIHFAKTIQAVHSCQQIPCVPIMLCVPGLFIPLFRLHLTPWGQKGTWDSTEKGGFQVSTQEKVCIFVAIKSCLFSLKIISHHQKHERWTKINLRWLI